MLCVWCWYELIFVVVMIVLLLVVDIGVFSLRVVVVWVLSCCRRWVCKWERYVLETLRVIVLINVYAVYLKLLHQILLDYFHCWRRSVSLRIRILSLPVLLVALEGCLLSWVVAWSRLLLQGWPSWAILLIGVTRWVDSWLLLNGANTASVIEVF